MDGNIGKCAEELSGMYAAVINEARGWGVVVGLNAVSGFGSEETDRIECCMAGKECLKKGDCCELGCRSLSSYSSRRI